MVEEHGCTEKNAMLSDRTLLVKAPRIMRQRIAGGPPLCAALGSARAAAHDHLPDTARSAPKYGWNHQRCGVCLG
jgi:hypothetical protein